MNRILLKDLYFSRVSYSTVQLFKTDLCMAEFKTLSNVVSEAVRLEYYASIRQTME